MPKSENTQEGMMQRIKKELVESVSEQYAGTETINDELSDNEMETSTLMSSSNTSTSENDDNQSQPNEMPNTQSQQHMVATTTICKRKSADLSEMIHHQKQLHTMKSMNLYQLAKNSVNGTQDDRIPVNTGNISTDNVSVTEEDMENQLPSGTKPVGAETRHSYQPSDSDREWEVISQKIRTTSAKRDEDVEESKQARKPLMMQTQKSVGAQYRPRSNVRVVTTTKAAPTHKEIMKNRGGYMTDDKETNYTQLKVEFNILHTTEEFNIILAVETLFKTLVQVDSSI